MARSFLIVSIRPLDAGSGTREDSRVSDEIDTAVRPVGNPRRASAWPWVVAAVSLVALMGAAGFRAAPGVLMQPLEEEFGWSRATIGTAVAINLMLYGLFSPFAAALMERFGMRKVVCFALVMVSLGSGLTLWMAYAWQLMLLWGVAVGVGTGSMALTFVATVTSRWFVRHAGLVSGVLTAGGAAGQLVFLPLMAWLATNHGWRTVSGLIALAALAVVPLALFGLRENPADVGTVPWGADPDSPAPAPPRVGSSAGRALSTLREAARHPTFWLLAGSFAICGASTNGLVGTHFVPAAHDHGMPMELAAGLLALIGIFDIAGTVASGWLTDHVDPRWLLATYYLLRGLSLLALPSLLGPTTTPPMWAFVVFYGLDWVATVPPTVMMCRRAFGSDGAIVFGWVFASHQIGAAIVASAAGLLRDRMGDYHWAWLGSGMLCVLATVMCLALRRQPRVVPA
ncbi:MFS transporter [Naumannella sp. ID2617S]|nr:MFS transporter [Naumannella sp. ID2617S]